MKGNQVVLNHPRINVRDTTWLDAALPSLGSEGPFATLEFDGKAVLQGNRSRMTLFGGELSRCLADGGGRTEVVALRAELPSMLDVAVAWECPAASVLNHAEHFGATLVNVLRRGKIVLAKPKPLRLAAGDRLAFTFRNLRSSSARVDVALIVKLAQ